MEEEWYELHLKTEFNKKWWCQSAAERLGCFESACPPVWMLQPTRASSK